MGGVGMVDLRHIRPENTSDPALPTAGAGGYDVPSDGTVTTVRRRSPSGNLAASPMGVVLLGGVWLIVARFVYEYGRLRTDAVTNGVVLGVAITLVALIRLSSPASNPTLSLVAAVMGGWMFAAPWVFGYATFGPSSAAAWNDLIVGVVVVVFSLLSFFASLASRARTW
jgi:hypothetical protein